MLSQTARRSRGLLTRRLSAAGLYAGQDAVVLALADADGQSLSAIAARLGVRAPTVTKTINRLAAQGFVTKRASEADGRQSHVFLTDSGRNVIAFLREAIAEGERAALEGLTGKEVKTLLKLLSKVERNLRHSEVGEDVDHLDAEPVDLEKEGAD